MYGVRETCFCCYSVKKSLPEIAIFVTKNTIGLLFATRLKLIGKLLHLHSIFSLMKSLLVDGSIMAWKDKLQDFTDSGNIACLYNSLVPFIHHSD